jgi:lysophospholipase L1-like esterase
VIWLRLTLPVLVFALVVAESIPRLLELPDRLAIGRTVGSGLYVLDDAAGYVMQPGYVGRWSGVDYDQSFRTNGRGLRGPELEPKQPGQFRIVVIGDSMVFGGQVREEQRFTERIETVIRARGLGQVQVVNVGVPGWTTFNEAGFLATNSAWLQPDLVVLAVYLGNDVEENVMATIGGYLVDATNGITYGQRTRDVVGNSVAWFPHNFAVGAAEYALPQVVQPAWQDGDPLPAPVGNPVASGLPAGGWARVSLNYVGLDGARTWLKRNSRLYLGASDGWFALRHGYNRPIALGLNQWLAFTLRDPPRQYWLDLGYPLTEHYLAQARDASLAAGARMVVLLIPHDAQLNADKMATELGRFHLAREQVDVDRPRRELIAQAGRLGLDIIDLLPALSARADRANFTYRHDFHFTPLGHAVVAEVLADELDRLGALPAMLEGSTDAQP